MSLPQLSKLPPSWSWRELGQHLTAIEAGRSFKCDERPPRDGEVGVVKVSAVTWGEYDEREAKTCTDATRVEPRFFIQAGDFLLSRANTISLVGNAVIARNVTGCVMLSDKILRLHFKDVDPRWVLYALRSPHGRREIERLATGNQESMRNIGQDRIRQIRLPYAPEPHQQLVIAEVEKQLTRLAAGVEALERLRVHLRRYRAAVLKAACEGQLVDNDARNGDGEAVLRAVLSERRARWDAEATVERRRRYLEPTVPTADALRSAVPTGWTIASLDQLTDACRPICYGILMPKENVPDGVLYVRVKDMKGDRINVAGLHRTSPKIASAYARASLKPGDLLLAIRGTYGRVAEVPPELEGGNITQDTARLALLPGVNRRFIAWFLRSPDAQNYFTRVARGVAVKGVNIGDVRPAPVLLPPLNQQERIVVEIERRMSQIDHLEREVTRDLQRSPRLRQTILKTAFEGHLLPPVICDQKADTPVAGHEPRATVPAAARRKRASV